MHVVLYLSSVDCNVSDLLLIGNCSDGRCVEFNGTCVGDRATYFTTSDYCISTGGLRECQDDRMWSGSVPDTLKGNTRQKIGCY